MAKRLIKEGILVARDGKRITPEIGKVFDLTADEIKDLERMRPQAIAKVGTHEEDAQSKPVDDAGNGEGDGGEVDLTTLDRNALIALADERGVSIAKNASREKIIAALVDAEDGGDGL